MEQYCTEQLWMDASFIQTKNKKYSMTNIASGNLFKNIFMQMEVCLSNIKTKFLVNNLKRRQRLGFYILLKSIAITILTLY